MGVHAVPVSRMIYLLAVKGGPGGGSDCEIEFIKRVLPLLGATPRDDYQEEGSKKGGKALKWSWDINRPGAGVCIVQLRQYEQPQDATNIDRVFYPDAASAAAPDL